MLLVDSVVKFAGAGAGTGGRKLLENVFEFV